MGVTATSPMSCTVAIVIVWQDWIGQPPLRLEHELDFCRDGGCWDYGVDLHAALTGNVLEDLSQAQTLQRSRTRTAANPEDDLPLFSGERERMNATTSIPSNGSAEVTTQPLLARPTECGKPGLQHSTCKRVGPLSKAWADVCRHLP